jgi:hypothetical protein
MFFDLATGQAGVALGAADDEAAGRVDQEACALEQCRRDHRLDDLLDHRLGQRLVRDVGGVLGRDDDRVDAHRAAVDVLDGDLRLRIRAQPRQLAVAAHLGLAFHQAVRVVDRHRHQFRRLVTGEAVHQALVAGALVEVEALAFIDAGGDVHRLLVVAHQHAAALVVEADVRIGVADALHDLACDLCVVDLGAGGDLACHHDQAGVHQGLGGDAAMLVLRQDRIQGGVGNRVGDLVGMAFRYRFRGKQKFAHWETRLL